jgi:hypothetical protein
VSSCERDVSDLPAVSLSKNPDVFIDGFSAGLTYAAFGGSVPTAFQVDKKETYNNSAASMRFEVPDANDPRGAYAGGAFFTEGGRNLSSYNVLTFWAKASKAAILDVVGIGNDLGENKYLASISDLKINTNWQKYYIPLPDPNKLTNEKGMFFYSEGPENERGYTIWIDEVKFEDLGTLAHPTSLIMNGENIESVAETGTTLQVTGLKTRINLPTGINQDVNASINYFEFSSSNEAVASVNNLGQVTVKDAGIATITAKVGNDVSAGSIIVRSIGIIPGPSIKAPIPNKDADKVISMFSNAYTNVPIDTWNTRWQFSTAEETFIKVENDDVIRYRNLNFVGIEFASKTIDAGSMTHFHIDIWTPDATNLPKALKLQLVDFGPNNSFGGGDDSAHELSFTSPLLATGSWVSIDVPLTAFTGLTSKRNLAQLVLSGDLPNLYIDNVYFYNGTTPLETAPSAAAPTPNKSPDDVISIYSNAYTNIPNTDFNPNWGQATKVTDIQINGNNTLRYEQLNYQGTQFGMNIDVSEMKFLHIDFWTSNSTNLNIFMISPGPVETPYKLTVPTTGWSSLDIPISAFSPVDLKNIFQFKVEGNGDIFFDNIYFHK